MGRAACTRATRNQLMRDARRCLPVLVYAVDRLGPKGRIILGSGSFVGWFFCFYDKGKLFSSCPFLSDHLNRLHQRQGRKCVEQRPHILRTGAAEAGSHLGHGVF